jgi:hypothetical protein
MYKMVDNSDDRSEAGPRRVLRNAVRSWWSAVVAGQVDHSHPLHGPDVQGRIEDDTLVITGRVRSESDRAEVEREIEHLIGHGVSRVRNELQVAAESQEEKGLLAQTLVGVFATEEQAGYAAGYLEGHAHFRPQAMAVVAPNDPHNPVARAHALLPEAYWQDAEQALSAGQTLVIAVVDEVDAFKARELLEEETRSVRIQVLPPEPAHATRPSDRARHSAGEETDGERLPHLAAQARKRALRKEQTLHES